jgi:hypothetical protein
MLFHLLPLSIYGLLRDYIIEYGAYESIDILNEQIMNWRNFLFCSKDLFFKEIKRSYDYYHFSPAVPRASEEESLLFPTHIFPSDLSNFSDEQLGSLFDEELNPLNQVSVYFNSDIINRTPVETPFFNVHACSLFMCSIDKISFLKNVKYVTLMDCSVSSVNGSWDLSVLQSCLYVDLSRNFTKTPGIVNNENLHFLSNVKRLNLDGCSEISDVSCLSKVYDLSLMDCKGIKDVSMLRYVYRLNLCKCIGIEDISMLDHVCCLDISFNWKIMKGLPIVNRLREIRLSNSSFLHSTNALFKKPKLCIRLCGEFSFSYEAIYLLENCRIISIEHSDSCPSLSMFQNAQQLSIVSSTLSSYLIASLSKVIYLYLEKCRSVDNDIKIDFLSLPSLEEVTIKKCNIKGFEILTTSSSKLKKVSLSECQFEDGEIMVWLPGLVERINIKLKDYDPDIKVVMMMDSTRDDGLDSRSLFHCNCPQKLQYIVKKY